MKKIIFFLTFINVIILAGCAEPEDILNKEKVMRLAGITEDSDYQKYLELQAEGLLDQNGEYNQYEDEEAQIEQAEQKQIRVTIADNGFLKVSYFYDPGLTEKVTGSPVYLDPGERLYCSQPESINVHSNTYVFSEFHIYEYDAEGNRGNLFAATGENSMVLEIPEDYEGTELAVFPVGIYEMRGLTFHAFYYDENGNSRKALSTWSVNDEVCIDNTVSISANESYTVKCQYNENEYYYVEANPAPYSTKQLGIVEFRRATALNSEDTYSVQLHKFITAFFSYDNNGKEGIASVSINNQPEDFDKDRITGLKTGDRIVITTSDYYRIFCNGFALNEPEEIEDGYRYTMNVPKTNESELDFKVAKSELQVVLDETVGYDAAFDIIGSGISEKNCSYSKQKHGKEAVIFDGTIGVEENVSITARGDTIAEGYALKVEVEKTDGNSQKQKEIKYIASMPGNIEINLYNGSGQITNLNKIYRSVFVKVSLVKVISFNEKTIENGTIFVRLLSNPASDGLSDGDVAEASQRVEVTIIPDEGYYVSGKNVDNDKYASTMKLSKYESDMDDIIKKHEIRKWYEVTLEEEDAYGQCVYKLNGEEKSGLVVVREEDELILEYELTNTDYWIVRESEGFWGRIGDWRKNTFSDRKEKVTIPLSEEMDGSTIKRSDYIKVEEEHR